MKVNLNKIYQALLKISSAQEWKSFKKPVFNIKKSKASSIFSNHNVIALTEILPLIIFEAILFYQIKANEKLDFSNQKALKILFESSKDKIFKKCSEIIKNQTIMFQILNCLSKYEALVAIEKNKISSRLFKFDSKTSEHKHCLGGEIPKQNIVIKFRGAQSEAIHIRIGIKVIRVNGKLEFILQDIVNKKDRNP